MQKIHQFGVVDHKKKYIIDIARRLADIKITSLHTRTAYSDQLSNRRTNAQKKIKMTVTEVFVVTYIQLIINSKNI